MKMRIKSDKPVEPAVLEAIEGQLDGVWTEAATQYFAEYTAAVGHGKAPPKGIQKHINENLDKRFVKSGWDGAEGRYVKDSTWLRITFRHQMSLGSDFLDALLLAYREGITQIIIAAPAPEFAKLVTPGDAGSIATFGKLEEYYSRAKDLFQVPIAIGSLTQKTLLSGDVQDLVMSRLK